MPEITSNALYTILAYKKEQVWCFDDASRNIKEEPFVCGASELIDKLVLNKYGKKKRKVRFVFSENPIKDHDCFLTLTEAHYPLKATGRFTTMLIKGKYVTRPIYADDKKKAPVSGTYISEDGDICWLCPAQMKFFGRVANTIYVKF